MLFAELHHIYLSVTTGVLSRQSLPPAKGRVSSHFFAARAQNDMTIINKGAASDKTNSMRNAGLGHLIRWGPEISRQIPGHTNYV